MGGIQALDNINLDVLGNKILARLGDNGAGKSTLIKTLSGAHALDEDEMHSNYLRLPAIANEWFYRLTGRPDNEVVFHIRQGLTQ